jgi:hypothetical protein
MRSMGNSLSPACRFFVETLFTGRVRIVTPDGEVYVSNGRPDADTVLRYLDRGMTPKGSAKWTFAGQATQGEMVRIADTLSAAYGRPRGCERCDGEGSHFSGEPCSA